MFADLLIDVRSFRSTVIFFFKHFVKGTFESKVSFMCSGVGAKGSEHLL